MRDFKIKQGKIHLVTHVGSFWDNIPYFYTGHHMYFTSTFEYTCYWQYFLN